MTLSNQTSRCIFKCIRIQALMNTYLHEHLNKSMKTSEISQTFSTATRYDYILLIIKSPKLAPNSQGTSWSVLLNVLYHKEYHYIWLSGGDLNGFPDIKPFMLFNGSCRRNYDYMLFRVGI